jgi:hypothetical protein
MKPVARPLLSRLLALMTCAILALASGTAGAQSTSRFDRPALDAMLAPIALYPDGLLSQVLMAATYPEEVQEAAAWLRARPGLSGDAAVRSSADQDWDPAVRSLLAFPMVLETMASHSRWTEDLGEAFLNQRVEVMDTVQALRRRAYDAGTLRSNEAIRVLLTASGIVIEQARPDTVYVPYYEPQVAYGGWWWPSHPPVHWPRWHGYVDPYPHSRYFSWGPGIFVGSGFFFGGFVWPRHEVRVVHVHPHYYPRRVVVERHVVPGRRDPVIVHRDARPGVWKHDDWRRRHDRADFRRDHDRREAQARRPGDTDGRGVDDRRRNRDRDAVPDRTQRTDRNNDGIPDRTQRTDRNNDGVPDRMQTRQDRDGDWRRDSNRGRADRDRDGVPDRRHATSDLRRNDRSDERGEWRTQPRQREVREPRSVERAERPAAPRAAPQSAARESRPAPRARVDPSNRD